MSDTPNDDVGSRRDIEEDHAAVLADVADHLIPAAHGMPSAADVVRGARLRFVLDARPDLIAPFTAALRPDIGADAAARLAHLAAEEPVHLMALQLVVVGGYYTDPRVREALGYPGQVAKPVNAHEFPEYIADGLIDAVIARGPIWRDPAVDPAAVEAGGT